MTRRFRLSDIPTLFSDKNEMQYPHSVSNLTWGQSLITLGAGFSSIGETIGVMTAVEVDQVGKTSSIAQVFHNSGAEVANLSFFSSRSTPGSPAFNNLIEYLIKLLGERKAHSLVAEVLDGSAMFNALHNENFSSYARQQIWELKSRPKLGEHEVRCRWLAGLDAINAHRLYNRIVPQLIQSIETGPLKRLRGVVCYRDDELVGYTDVTSGPWGIWAQPFISTNDPDPQLILREMLNLLAPRRWRPVYICVRTYQSHLYHVLQDLGAVPGSKQIVLARRLTSAAKKPALSPIPQINGSREATTPYSHQTQNNDN